MKVVRHKRPGIHNEVPVHAQIRQPVQEIFPVSISAEYFCPFDASSHDMVQSSGSIESWLPGHIEILHPFASTVKLF
jgi:hypothetical protein